MVTPRLPGPFSHELNSASSVVGSQTTDEKRTGPHELQTNMAAPIRKLPTAVTRHFMRFPNKLTLVYPQRWCSITGNEKIDKTLDTVTGGKIGGWLQRYENVVGLTEVREAQEKVIQVRNEQQFIYLYHHGSIMHSPRVSYTESCY